MMGQGPDTTRPAAPGGTFSRIPTRAEVDPRHTWELDTVFPDDDAWNLEFEKVEQSLPELQAFKGRLGESSAVLLDFLQTRDRLLQPLGRLSVYAHLKRDEDTREAHYQGLYDRVSKLGSRLGEILSFVAPELLAIDPEELEGFMHESPGLQVYRHYIEDVVRARPHTLSAREEEIVAMTADMARGPYLVFSMLDNADLVFPKISDSDGHEVELTKGRYYRLMESTDRRVRRDAFEAFYGTYTRYKNTFAAALQSQLKRSLFYARVRNYESTLHAALDTYHIPVRVLEHLVETTNDHLEPLHRYNALRKRVLKLDELHPYDMSVPLVPEAAMHFEYDEATELVRAALQPMGKEYAEALDRAFTERWIDVHETQGKRSGAYSSGAYGTSPYILLNFNGTLDSVFTLAHELGHSLHTYFSHRHQPYIYSDYAIFVAEVASTASESLLLAHMLKHTDDPRRRLYLLNHWVDQIRGTFFTQVFFADFERAIHQATAAGEPLTQETLSERFRTTYERFHGPEVVNDELNHCGWSRIPHFYYNFYVYQYATGYAAASALAQRLLKGSAGALDAYLQFLKSGSSAYPIELLKCAGVDMTRPEPVADTIGLFDRLVGEIEELVAGEATT